MKHLNRIHVVKLALDVVLDEALPEELRALSERACRTIILPASLLSSVREQTKNIELATAFLTMSWAAAASFTVCTALSSIRDVRRKEDNPREVFSVADTLSSKIIRAILKEGCPEYGLLDEEFGGERLDAKRIFIFDPVDGSASYLLGVEEGWAVGIAIHDLDDVKAGGTGIISGVILSPRRTVEDTFVGGIKHVGCWNRNGDKVSVTDKTTIADVGASVGHQDLRKDYWWKTIHVFAEQIMRLYAGIDAQHSGSWIAQGHLDIFLRMDQPCYDISPIIGVVEAAGGKVMEFDGKEVTIERNLEKTHNFIAWNGQEALKNHILNLMKKRA